jgi:hypothetical protein
VTDIRLTGPQLKQLAAALRRTFLQQELVELLEFDLDRRKLDDYTASTDNMQTIIFKVIKAAEKEGWLLQFIEAASKARPKESELATLYTALQPGMGVPAIDSIDDIHAVRFVRKDWAFVNRRCLRTALQSLCKDQSRILIVDGQPKSGKTYSLQLISYLKEKIADFKMAWVDLERLAREVEDRVVLPENVGEAISAQLGLLGMPERQQEQAARWVRRFCDWLTDEFEQAATMHWIVIDHFDKTLLAQGTHDLIQELALRLYVNMPMLRLILLSYTDLAGLQAVIVGGNVEHESILPIGEPDLTLFFLAEFEDRKLRRQIAYTPNEVADSVARVLREVDPAHPQRLQVLRRAVATEVNRLAI